MEKKYIHKITGQELTLKKSYGEVAGTFYTGAKKFLYGKERRETVVCTFSNLVEVKTE